MVQGLVRPGTVIYDAAGTVRMMDFPFCVTDFNTYCNSLLLGITSNRVNAKKKSDTNTPSRPKITYNRLNTNALFSNNENKCEQQLRSSHGNVPNTN